MNSIETAVRWRHGTFVLFLLLVMFGFIALFRLPLELQPGGDRPEITISTPYIGAAPSEVENLITRPIENVLEEIEKYISIAASSLWMSGSFAISSKSASISLTDLPSAVALICRSRSVGFVNDPLAA